jgi:hypothetical protein
MYRANKSPLDAPYEHPPFDEKKGKLSGLQSFFLSILRSPLFVIFISFGCFHKTFADNFLCPNLDSTYVPQRMEGVKSGK